eukprot:46749-Pelagomonas_calceolata.AAC.1
MQWNASNKHDEHSADEFKESQDVEKGVPTVRLEQEQGKDGKEVSSAVTKCKTMCASSFVQARAVKPPT